MDWPSCWSWIDFLILNFLIRGGEAAAALKPNRSFNGATVAAFVRVRQLLAPKDVTSSPALSLPLVARPAPADLAVVPPETLVTTRIHTAHVDHERDIYVSRYRLATAGLPRRLHVQITQRFVRFLHFAVFRKNIFFGFAFWREVSRINAFDVQSVVIKTVRRICSGKLSNLHTKMAIFYLSSADWKLKPVYIFCTYQGQGVLSTYSFLASSLHLEVSTCWRSSMSWHTNNIQRTICSLWASPSVLQSALLHLWTPRRYTLVYYYYYYCWWLEYDPSRVVLHSLELVDRRCWSAVQQSIAVVYPW